MGNLGTRVSAQAQALLTPVAQASPGANTVAASAVLATSDGLPVVVGRGHLVEEGQPYYAECRISGLTVPGGGSLAFQIVDAVAGTVIATITAAITANGTYGGAFTAPGTGTRRVRARLLADVTVGNHIATVDDIRIVKRGEAGERYV